MGLLTFQNIFQYCVEEHSFYFTSWETETQKAVLKEWKREMKEAWRCGPFGHLSTICPLIKVRYSTSPTDILASKQPYRFNP